MFDFNLFLEQLEEAFRELWSDLRKITGWNFGSVYRAITQILSQAEILIPLWAVASPEERKKAVVTVVNEKINIPIIGEGFEAVVFGFIYDAVLRRLF